MSDPKKLTKAFGEGAFGMPDLPHKIGHGHYAHLDHPEGELWQTTKADRRSWKRHRKRRWRSK